ncbi:MAG: hypothetical protein ACJA2S_005776, partial [Cyclobacteriaceae bacterium]
MDVLNEAHFRQGQYNNRRQFLKKCMSGMGGLALGSMLGGDLLAKNLRSNGPDIGMPHFVPKAKRVIYLHMAGAPSQ